MNPGFSPWDAFWKRLRFLVLPCVSVLVLVVPANAHIGAPDVYVKASAGPYNLLISIHPPASTPGAAGIDVRTEDPGVTAISVALPAGNPQPLQRFPSEQIFTGSAWVASAGAWRVAIHVSGNKGEAETTVPIPSSSTSQPLGPLGWNAETLLLVLVAAVVVFAAFFPFRRNRRSTIAGLLNLTFIGMAVALVMNRKAAPATPPMQLTLLPEGKLQIALPGKDDDLVEDHNHLMHLFAVRQPQMDVLLHLHPTETSPGNFATNLPSMAPGAFTLYADVVHRDGRLETFTASAGLPQQTARILQGDDSVGVIPGLSRSQPITGPATTSVRLMDGYTMTLALQSPLRAKAGQLLRFSLLDPQGNPPPDMQLYMGMPAHAAVLKTDATVFAHIHPAGTLPMAAYGANMTGMEMPSAATSQVSFPFGFPTPGAYRVFVEMKHANIVETAAFDLLIQ